MNNFISALFNNLDFQEKLNGKQQQILIDAVDLYITSASEEESAIAMLCGEERSVQLCSKFDRRNSLMKLALNLESDFVNNTSVAYVTDSISDYGDVLAVSIASYEQHHGSYCLDFLIKTDNLEVLFTNKDYIRQELFILLLLSVDPQVSLVPVEYEVRFASGDLIK